jgi:hypothetical protein
MTDLQRDRASRPVQASAGLQDFPIVLRTGKGAIPETTPVDILSRACDEAWMTACYDLGAIFLRGGDVPRDPARAMAAFEKACSAGVGSACSDLGLMHYSGDGVPLDRAKGLEYLRRACDVGLAQACQWYKETQSSPESPNTPVGK